MAMSKLEQAIYLAENLPQGEYDVDDYEVWAGARGGKRGKQLIGLEWNRYDESENMVIDRDYELLMSSGVEIIRHLLGLLVECRKLFWEDHDNEMGKDLADALAATRDYDPPAA